MRALADRWNPSPPEPPPTFPELPAETDAWWLSRAQASSFARRRITLPDACAAALRDRGAGRIAVEFNGASFEGATLAANDGHSELDLGDALAEEMAEVLDEDDGLEIEVLEGRGRPVIAIHPYVVV